MNFSKRPGNRPKAGSAYRLLGGHFKLHFSFIAIAKVDPGFEGAELLYFVQDVDATAIDLIAFLVADCAGQLDGGNTAEYLAAGTGLGADLQW
jgi:hypothetical protein